MKLRRSVLLMPLIVTFSAFSQPASLFPPVVLNQQCPNGTERLRADIKQTRKWVLAESIEFTKRSAAYVESNKNALKTLSTAGEVIDYINKLAKLDDLPGAEIPMKYFQEILKAGNEIAQAGGRLSAQEKKKLVDLVVTIKLTEVSVECAALEVCENGKWVRKGFKPMGEATRRKLDPLVKQDQGVLAGELWQRIDKHSRTYAALQERFDADACAGAVETPPKPQPPAAAACKPAPPCPECKTHYDKIATACERIKEIDDELVNRIYGQLPQREERVKTATGNELATLREEIASLKADKQKLESEKTGLQTAIRVDTANMKECEKHCSKPVTGGSRVPGFDPCVVGTWRSVQAFSEFNHWANGGEGVILTVAGDGQAAIDYSKMQPNVLGERTRTWGGKATGRLTSSNNTLTVSGTAFEVTITYTGPGQSGQERPMTKNGLGNLLQAINDAGTQSIYRYTCDGTTLVITGYPWSSAFKRVGTLP